MAEETVAHDFLESGTDSTRGAYTQCSCGWESGWLTSAADAHDALQAHWGSLSRLRARENENGSRRSRSSDR